MADAPANDPAPLAAAFEELRQKTGLGSEHLRLSRAMFFAGAHAFLEILVDSQGQRPLADVLDELQGELNRFDWEKVE